VLLFTSTGTLPNSFNHKVEGFQLAIGVSMLMKPFFLVSNDVQGLVFLIIEYLTLITLNYNTYVNLILYEIEVELNIKS